MQNDDLFKEYCRTHRNFDKCMLCLEDIMLIATKQNNIPVAERVKELLNDLEKVDKLVENL